MNLENFSERIARAQVAHRWRFLGLSLVATVVALAIASGLQFDSTYWALMPENAPQVVNAEDVRERTGGTRQLIVAIGGQDPEARLAIGRKLVVEIRKLPNVRSAEIELPVEFFRTRSLWLMSLEGLDRLVPALEEAVKIAKWNANPLALHLDEEQEARDLERAWKKVDDIADSERGELPFDGVITSKDGIYTFLTIIPTFSPLELDKGKALFDQINEATLNLDPASKGVTTRIAGRFAVAQEQHRIMRSDLRNASIIALVFGVIIVMVFTRRFTSPVVVGAGLLTGIAWTLALARLVFGHLNVITGFLVAVLIGLGIDFCIHILVRYQQERKFASATPAEAVIASVRGTFPPALVSALTTSGAFFSFFIADFRGFSEFGLLAGTGVLLTLASSFAILPPVLLVIDGRKNTRPVAAGAPRKPASKRRIPLAAAAVVVIVMVCWAIWGGIRVTSIPFVNDFKLLRGESEATEFFEYVHENMGLGFNPAVFLVSSVDDARIVHDAIETTRLDRGKSSMIDRSFSASTLLPDQIDERTERIDRLAETLLDPKLDRAEAKEGERAEQLANAREMVKTRPWSVDDLPEQLRERLTSTDGSELIVFVWPTEHIDSDIAGLVWKRELDEISARLDEQKISYSTVDETLMAAWIHRLIEADGPPLLAVAALVVLLLISLDLRRISRIAILSCSLFVGMLGFAGLIAMLDLQINMFNLIVIPSVIGIGIDNAVHIYHRYLTEGPGSVATVVRHTGVAALLASLTTGVGFGSSLVSHSLGLRSLGLLAVIGIGFTLVAATVFFPCLLVLIERLHPGNPDG